MAYNASGAEVDVDELTLATGAVQSPPGLDLDACTATAGQPGNFTFKVSGLHITRLEMHYANSAGSTKPSDPHIAFNDLSFVIEGAEVQVDIRPDSSSNNLNLKSKGTLPVAILSSASFSAATVAPLTVKLAGAPVSLKKNGTPMASLEDVNGDGRLDLMLHFDIQALPRFTADTVITLVGETFGGQPVSGKVSIHLVH